MTVTLDLSLTPRPTSSLHELAVELYLGNDTGIGAVRCDVGRAPSGFGSSPDVEGGGSDSWSYDPKRRVLRWEVHAKARIGGAHTLKGSWSTTTTTGAPPRPARALQVTFASSASTFSGLRIDQLKVSAGESYKPYKGMRGRSIGKVEWRI